MSADLLRRLIEAGTPAELVAEVAMLAGDAAALERRRAADRARQQSLRDEKASHDVTLRHVTSRDTADVTGPGSLDKESPQTPKEIKPSREVNTLPACATLDLPEGVSDEMWGQYRAMRQKIRKPLSPHAEQLALKHLRQFAEDGHPPGPIIEAAIVGSYQGLFPPKGSKNGQHRKPDHEWGSTVAAAQSLIADLSGGQGTGSADRPPGAGH